MKVGLNYLSSLLVTNHLRDHRFRCDLKHILNDWKSGQDIVDYVPNVLLKSLVSGCVQSV